MHIGRLELKRQLFHLFLGIAIVLLFKFNILNVLLLSIILTVGVIASILIRKIRIPVIGWCLNTFDRGNVRFPGEGAAFYVLGCLLSLAIFPGTIAFASIMVLAVGDSFSTLIGKGFGNNKISGSKTYEGMAAGIITGFIGAVFFVPGLQAFLGSAVAMTFEAFEIKFKEHTIDDNLFIPVIAGSVMSLIALL